MGIGNYYLAQPSSQSGVQKLPPKWGGPPVFFLSFFLFLRFLFPRNHFEGEGDGEVEASLGHCSWSVGRSAGSDGLGLSGFLDCLGYCVCVPCALFVIESACVRAYACVGAPFVPDRQRLPSAPSSAGVGEGGGETRGVCDGLAEVPLFHIYRSYSRTILHYTVSTDKRDPVGKSDMLSMCRDGVCRGWVF